MKRGALYVEIDKFAAAWLRELIAWDLIADGDVYEGSFEDLTPADLDRYVQVHLCAGIGVWSYALRQAGWPDDRPVWTASFPCQPFSAAGQGKGFTDERHLWPTGHWLIDQCRPVTLFGEQVASRPGLEWFDLVSSDLEGSGYTIGAHDLCAAGVGAPHIRQRLYFMGVADGAGSQPWRSSSAALGHGNSANPASRHGNVVDAAGEQARFPGCSRVAGSSDRLLADNNSPGSAAHSGNTGKVCGLQEAQRQPEHGAVVSGRSGGLSLDMADADGRHASAERLQRSRQHGQQSEDRWTCDWIPCRDGKWRPVEPGTFPLAHGAPARVGRLRGYGNGLVAPVAEAFIRAVMTCL